MCFRSVLQGRTSAIRSYHILTLSLKWIRSLSHGIWKKTLEYNSFWRVQTFRQHEWQQDLFSPENQDASNFSGIAGPSFKHQIPKYIIFGHVGAMLGYQILGTKSGRLKEMSRRLKAVSGAGAMKPAQVHSWLSEIWGRHEDVFDSCRSLQYPQIGSDEILVHRLEHNPHAKTWKLTYSLKILLHTVVAHLREDMDMKCFHLR
jgi:hypothetical protein